MTQKRIETDGKPKKGVNISDKTRHLYDQRDKNKDRDDPPQLSPAMWANATLRKFYRPAQNERDIADATASRKEARKKGTKSLAKLRAELESEAKRQSLLLRGDPQEADVLAWLRFAELKIPKFKSEAEEADWLYAHRRQLERELRSVEKSGKGKAAMQIFAEYQKHRPRKNKS